MATYVERILVPDHSRSRLLVVGGDVPALPMWSLEDPEPNDSFHAARTRFGVTSPFLRVVRLEGNDMLDSEVFQLLEFDTPPASWRPLSGLVWLPFAEIAGAVDAGPFGRDVAAWIAEQQSGVIPLGRSEWARPGWFELAVAWLTRELAGLGRTTTGPVEQISSWEIGSLLAVDTDRGRVVLKTVPQLFGHEPELTRALANEHPELLPVVIATDSERRSLLMEAFGGTPLFDEAPVRWDDALVAISTIHHAWIGRRGRGERIGVEDRSLAALGRELDSIMTDEAASPGLDPAAAIGSIANLPLYRDLIGETPGRAGPGDADPCRLPSGNVQRDGDRLVVYDWSDARWGHPFFDVPTMTSRTDDSRPARRCDRPTSRRGPIMRTGQAFGRPSIGPRR